MNRFSHLDHYLEELVKTGPAGCGCAMAEVPVAFDSGTRWLYGFGNEMVAGLIEAVSGMTVGEFFEKGDF